jgi:ubiquinone/menaquinone biosynthesis C-methylase UbiE
MSDAPATIFQNAEAYELIMGRWSRRLAPQLIQFGGLRDGDRVLDVGCGTGSLTFILPEFANISAVVGVDLVEGYVEFAKSHNKDSRITFQQGDACNLPLEDKSFDRAFSMLVLHFIPDSVKALSEMRRVSGPAAQSRLRSGMDMAVSPITGCWWTSLPRLIPPSSGAYFFHLTRRAKWKSCGVTMECSMLSRPAS